MARARIGGGRGMKRCDLSVILISLNSRHFLRDCLASINADSLGPYSAEIIVVDNGSTDGTLELLKTEWPQVQVIANATNVGFCKAGNQGAEASHGRYLLFLNDDTVMLPRSLERLLVWMDTHPRAGMIGSRLLNTDGTDQFSSGRSFTRPVNAIFGRKSILTRLFPHSTWARAYLLSDRIASEMPYEVDWLSAAAMLSRRRVHEEVGGLAEDFYYFHEQVYCARVKNGGHGVFLHPQSRIIHHEGVGSGVRTRRVRRRHVIAFHKAAYKWFCLHYALGPLHPGRALAAAGLATRAGLLIAAEYLKPDRPVTAVRQADRPEGGVAI
jgi:N-acetylglucosaminyl-diphospho-decaprenol L-rhamnosyltransferase